MAHPARSPSAGRQDLLSESLERAARDVADTDPDLARWLRQLAADPDAVAGRDERPRTSSPAAAVGA